MEITIVILYKSVVNFNVCILQALWWLLAREGERKREGTGQRSGERQGSVVPSTEVTLPPLPGGQTTLQVRHTTPPVATAMDVSTQRG